MKRSAETWKRRAAGLLLFAVLSWQVDSLAQGSLVYVNPPDHVIISRGSPTVFRDVDLDVDGIVDFTFRAGGSFQIFSEIGSRSIGIPKGGLDFGSFSIPLATGFSIGPSLSPPLEWQSSFQPGFPPGYWVGQTFHYADSLGTFGYWQPNMTAYLGVEFDINGGTHYGWIRMSTWFLEGVNGGIIEEWAYNSIPGQPILAGQVPEPGTLALLVAGAGFLWWRRKRSPAKGRRSGNSNWQA